MNDRSGLVATSLLCVTSHRDARGTLMTFDRESLPFAPVRIFAILDVPQEQSRAGHAVSCDQFLWVPTGSCRLNVDDGTHKSSTLLDSREHGILVPAGVWIELRDFAPQTVVMVFSPSLFSDTQYFDGPRPDVISARTVARDSAG